MLPPIKLDISNNKGDDNSWNMAYPSRGTTNPGIYIVQFSRLHLKDVLVPFLLQDVLLKKLKAQYSKQLKVNEDTRDFSGILIY